MTKEQSRREFLKFVGRGAATSASAASLFGSASFLAGCTSLGKVALGKVTLGSGSSALGFTPLQPALTDELLLVDGLSWSRLASFGDSFGGDFVFGSNCDYLAFFRLNEKGTDGLLWVNHESLHTLFVSGWDGKAEHTYEQVLKEQQAVGGSLLRVRQSAESGAWSVVNNDPLNRRLTAATKIPIIAPRAIAKSNIAVGTLANCAGGVTPWGSVLTCEENYDDFYGEVAFSANGKRTVSRSRLGWEKYFPHAPEHYGWVVEVNPMTGAAKKLTSMGRFAHESATVRVAKDGRCVVYSGDDANDQCLYKFISAKPGSLEKGRLYVANLEKGRWVSLDINQQKILKDFFSDQTEVLIRCREAALMVGGTPLARPEDVEIDPVTGSVYVVLTNHQPRGNYFGSILKIDENANDPLSLEFTSSTFVTGGVDSGFACPDNMAFDRIGNLWMTTDISGKQIGSGPYEPFKNNALLYIPMRGPNAGQAFRVAIAPMDAEFTGPQFSHDGRTLFLSVQHPGEGTQSLTSMTSHWPEGGSAVPKSTVVALQGPTLDRLVEGAAVAPVVKMPLLRS